MHVQVRIRKQREVESALLEVDTGRASVSSESAGIGLCCTIVVHLTTVLYSSETKEVQHRQREQKRVREFGAPPFLGSSPRHSKGRIAMLTRKPIYTYIHLLSTTHSTASLLLFPPLCRRAHERRRSARLNEVSRDGERGRERGVPSTASAEVRINSTSLANPCVSRNNRGSV
jgi:hypothetical protein